MEEKALKQTIERVFEAKVFLWRERKDREWLFLENKPDKGNVIPLPKYQSRLLAALHYEELGFSVVPMAAQIISADEIKKTPLIKWKPYQTTRATPEEIRGWWTQFPYALIGVICGKVSGIIAIDTDTPEGDGEFQSLLPEGLEIPICRTPRGGKHYILKYQDGIASISNDHFEVKSDGAIIILPPSKIPDGRGYEWMSCSL